MSLNAEEFLNEILKDLSQMDYIHPETIPGIDLYMDQVTTFINDHLSKSRRHPEDKILTKTMINNYAKNHLLPSPEKKRYSREHLLMLIFIYYFKNILSINDIETLLDPITEKYFKSSDGRNLSYIYNEVFGMEKARIESMKKDLTKSWHTAMETFSDADEEYQEFLKTFSFICLLSFDVYVKKMIIENLIDSMHPEESGEKKKKEKSPKTPNR